MVAVREHGSKDRKPGIHPVAKHADGFIQVDERPKLKAAGLNNVRSPSASRLFVSGIPGSDRNDND